jgi:hypothetical protein
MPCDEMNDDLVPCGSIPFVYGIPYVNRISRQYCFWYYTVSGETPTNACPHGDIQCVTYLEGMVYTSPKDMRLQFFETQEQCMGIPFVLR